MAMFYWIVMNVIHMPTPIFFISDMVLPKSRLPGFGYMRFIRFLVSLGHMFLISRHRPE